MGNYIKKLKIMSDVSIMEVSQPTPLAVRTRAAKTLALKRLNSSDSPPTSPSPTANHYDSSCYLQLRSRRLEKLPLLTEPKKHHQLPKHHQSRGDGIKESNSWSRVGLVNSSSAASGSIPVAQSCNGDDNRWNIVDNEGNFSCKGFLEMERGQDTSAEVSFGDNCINFESRYSSRESTPCNLVGDLAIFVTSGSCAKSRDTAARDYRQNLGNTPSIVPTTHELEEFFAFAEQQQQRLFMEKYNFDIVNDMPLPGRYEWVQVIPEETQ